jgi:hypothetical protein
MSVRFVDPRTNEVVYPEPFEISTNAVTSHSGTNAPTVGSLALNPLLASAMLSWDVNCPLETLVGQLPQDVQHRMGQSATLPPSTRLGIQSPHLPWRIEIRPRTPNILITVLDVLATVQKALGHQITPGEWGRFTTARKTITVAGRSSRVLEYDPGHRVDGMYNHPLRIDLLGELTRFGGLVPAPGRGPRCLDLKFEPRS